jgi:hypothetical protein
MFASKMMDNRVHISDGTTGGMPSGKPNNNHLFGHAIAEDLVRRYFSRSLDPKDKIGLPGFGMQALCLPPEKRVFKLCYSIELMAVIAGLVMFLSAYLLRFDAASTLGITGAFFANVSLMCNLTGIMNCLFMGYKLTAGKGSVYEAVDVLQGLGQTCMLIIFGANAAGMAYMFYSLDITTNDYLRWANLGFFIVMFCYTYFFTTWYMMSYEPLMVWHQWSWQIELFKPMFVVAWLRMGRVPLREKAAAQLEYFLADLPDDVMAILKADGNV